MADVTILVNGQPVRAQAGQSVAAALAAAGIAVTRTSVSGEPRGPLCGMGVCHECRATVDGRPHVKTCQVPCRAGLRVETPA